jgi:hypothetical protein
MCHSANADLALFLTALNFCQRFAFDLSVSQTAIVPISAISDNENAASVLTPALLTYALHFFEYLRE